MEENPLIKHCPWAREVDEERSQEVEKRKKETEMKLFVDDLTEYIVKRAPEILKGHTARNKFWFRKEDEKPRKRSNKIVDPDPYCVTFYHFRIPSENTEPFIREIVKEFGEVDIILIFPNLPELELFRGEYVREVKEINEIPVSLTKDEIGLTLEGSSDDSEEINETVKLYREFFPDRNFYLYLAGDIMLKGNREYIKVDEDSLPRPEDSSLEKPPYCDTAKKLGRIMAKYSDRTLEEIQEELSINRERKRIIEQIYEKIEVFNLI